MQGLQAVCHDARIATFLTFARLYIRIYNTPYSSWSEYKLPVHAIIAMDIDAHVNSVQTLSDCKFCPPWHYFYPLFYRLSLSPIFPNAHKPQLSVISIWISSLQIGETRTYGVTNSYYSGLACIETLPSLNASQPVHFYRPQKKIVSHFAWGKRVKKLSWTEHEVNNIFLCILFHQIRNQNSSIIQERIWGKSFMSRPDSAATKSDPR